MAKVDDMAKEVAKILTEYEGATVETMKKAVDNASKKAVSKLKASSPRMTGAYAQDWAAKKTNISGNKWAYEKTVYNRKHYRLTHLLEKGHKVVGAKNGRTWVAARPHIEIVEKEAIEDMVRDIKEGV